MIATVRATSSADVALYVDDDQYEDYRETLKLCDKFIVGEPKKGPVYALNYLCEAFPGYDAYGAATDDCTFEIKDWDAWVNRELTKMPAGIGCLAPHQPGSHRMDFPWISRRLLEIQGYLANPGCRHHYWDVGLEILGELTWISRAKPEEFTIQHWAGGVPDLEQMKLDARAVVLWCAFERFTLLKKIREETGWTGNGSAAAAPR